jgi:hypothetical protein
MRRVALLAVAFASLGAGQTFQRSYAIVIGIKTYKSLRTLPNASSDAKSIAALLKAQGYQLTELYDQDATRSNIIDAMDTVARTVDEHDRVLFFFAGHGFTETRGGQDWGYIAPYDGRPPITSSLIGMEELRTESQKMGRASHQLFLMDSCYGGSLGARDSPIGVDPRIPNYLTEITRRVAREALTAGGKDQQVEDGAINGHSRFTATLLEALQEGKADLNSDGYITFSELSAYTLPRATSRQQTPAQAWLPGHGLGEYWFVSPKSGRTVSSVSSAPSGQIRGDATGGGPGRVSRQVAPKPVPVVMTTSVTTRVNNSSGNGSSWGPFATICSDDKPHGWTIKNVEFHLEGDRQCGAWAECINNPPSTPIKACRQFRMQGHDEAKPGMRDSAGVLTVIWEHTELISPSKK